MPPLQISPNGDSMGHFLYIPALLFSFVRIPVIMLGPPDNPQLKILNLIFQVLLTM